MVDQPPDHSPGGRRPVPARIMLPALIPAELANRQARHHLSRHHAIQGRLGELATGPAIPHADLAGIALMPGRHSRDTVTGLAPGHAATPVNSHKHVANDI